MCLKSQECCFCFDLECAVKAIAGFGVILSLIYIILCLVGFQSIFTVLTYFEADYVYLGVFLCVVSFFVHLLLWQGASQEQRFKFIPWLVLIMLKTGALVAIAVNETIKVVSGQCGVSGGEDEDEVVVDCSVTEIVGIALTYLMAGVHLYFWVIVYSLYHQVSVKDNTTSPLHI